MNDTIKGLSMAMAIFTPKFQIKAAAPGDQTSLTSKHWILYNFPDISYWSSFLLLNLPNYLLRCRGKVIRWVCWRQSLKLVLKPTNHNNLTESSAGCAESREGVRLTQSTVSPEYRPTLCVASAGGGQEASLSCTALCRVCLKIHNQNVCCKALCGSITTYD